MLNLLSEVILISKNYLSASKYLNNKKVIKYKLTEITIRTNPYVTEIAIPSKYRLK